MEQYVHYVEAEAEIGFLIPVFRNVVLEKFSELVMPAKSGGDERSVALMRVREVYRLAPEVILPHLNVWSVGFRVVVVDEGWIVIECEAIPE